MRRYIMHVDMDAFFASVEQRDHEDYRGKPVIVGGLSARGVVATASYEARRFGIHSAMPMAAARKRCPDGIFLTGQHAHYREVSAQIFAVFARFSPLVEPLSIDEAFLDLTGMEHIMRDPWDYAVRLRQAVWDETGLIASVGIAPNKFLAKLASDLEKPDGLVMIAEDEVEKILWPLPVSRLWGVGKKTEKRLRLLGYSTIYQVAHAVPGKLLREFGVNMAEKLRALSHGCDDRPVVPLRDAQSIGKEKTFEQDLQTREQAEVELLSLSEKVGWRLRLAGRLARTIQLKVRLADFTTCTRSRTLREPISYDHEIYQIVCGLLGTMNFHQGIRLLGVTGTNFEIYGETSLFDDKQKQQNLYGAIDQLKKRFGEGVITKAQLLKSMEHDEGDLP